jgi:hypothetical protein
MARPPSISERLRAWPDGYERLPLGASSELLRHAADALDRDREEIAHLQESRSRMAEACEWLLAEFKDAAQCGGDHFKQRFCEEVVRRLRDALESPWGAAPAAEPKATRTTAVGPDGAVWGWET